MLKPRAERSALGAAPDIAVVVVVVVVVVDVGFTFQVPKTKC